MQGALPVAYARRINPRRRDVAVSSRLGKHIPTLGSVPVEDAHALAAKLAAVASDRTHVIGMAETATGLGFLVAQALAAKTFTTTTRRALSRECSALQFLETHSHAPAHGLCSSMSKHVEAGDTIVIVDDEATTGRTLSNLALPLSRAIPHDVGLMAAVLCDASTSAEHDFLLAERISLHQVEPTSAGEPDGLTPPDAALVRQIGEVHTFEPIECPDHAHALNQAAMLEMEAVAHLISKQFDQLEPSSTLVIGVEEFMPLPILVAQHLSCHVQSTTRSPIYTSRDHGYPIRAGWTFPAYTDPSQSAFLYNANTEHPEWTNAILLAPGATTGVSISPSLAGCIEVLRCIFRQVWIQPLSEIRRSPCAG